MARVLRSVKGHVYAYDVTRLGDGQREQRYIGPATEQEAAAWQQRRNVSKVLHCEAQGRPQNEAGVHLMPLEPDTTASGDIEGRGYWRDRQKPGAFLAEIVAIYTQRTGHAICNAGQVEDLQGRGVEVRSARVNVRMVILTGGGQ